VSRNVELTRITWEAFNRRDFETVLSNLDPDIEWRPAQGPGGPEGTVYHGHEEYMRWVNDDLIPVWETFQGENLEYRDLGDDRVLILGQIRGKGRASGVEVAVPFGQIAEIRDELAIRLTGYMDHESALEAAGL